MSAFNEEIRNRIRLSIAAYAYEYDNNSIMSDAEFDALSRKIRPSVKTGNPRLDIFFKNHFMPDTGMWIQKHPDLEGVKRTYEKYYK